MDGSYDAALFRAADEWMSEGGGATGDTIIYVERPLPVTDAEEVWVEFGVEVEVYDGVAEDNGTIESCSECGFEDAIAAHVVIKLSNKEREHAALKLFDEECDTYEARKEDAAEARAERQREWSRE